MRRRGGAGAGSHRRDPEAGDTLIEVLASLGIMAIAVVTIVAALGTLLKATDANERAAKVNRTLHTVGELLLERTGTYQYKKCTATGGEVSYADPPEPAELPTGWTVEIVSISYWDGVASRGTVGDPNHQPSPNYSSTRGHNTLRMLPTCPPGPVADYGVQEITIRAISDVGQAGGRTQDTLTIIKRNPECVTQPGDFSC